MVRMSSLKGSSRPPSVLERLARGEGLGSELHQEQERRPTVVEPLADSRILQACKSRNIEGVKQALRVWPLSIASKGAQGRTALHVACALPSLQLTQLLLENGADVNSQGKLRCPSLPPRPCNLESRACS